MEFFVFKFCSVDFFCQNPWKKSVISALKVVKSTFESLCVFVFNADIKGNFRGVDDARIKKPCSQILVFCFFLEI